MALVECPDCGRKISDRAKECPDCLCPVADVLNQERAETERDRLAQTREATEEEVDCPDCDARGWMKLPEGLMGWCIVCEHSGRVALCKAENGYYAVARYAVERFVGAEIHPETSGVCTYLGPNEPPPFKFAAAGERMEINKDLIPWELPPKDG